MKNITYDVMLEYVASRREEGASEATTNYELATLRKGLRLAKRSGKLDRMPDIPTDELTVDNVRKGFFEHQEFEKLYNELPDHHKPWVKVAYLTGWRARSEIIARQWKHVDRRARVLQLSPGETKNGRGCTFPFDVLPELKAVIDEQREYTKKWQKVKGKPIP